MTEEIVRTQVLVCGGGPGGIAAAVSAARNGADVLLVERYGFLGGMATAGLVNPFMTWFAGEEQIIHGIFQEILDRLKAKGGMGGPRGKGRSFDAEVFKFVADEICLESGVKLLLHSFASGVNVTGSRIDSVSLTSKPHGRTISADIYVDGTGDADVAYLAGVPCEKGRESDGLAQPMTLCFRMAGVDIDRMASRDEINAAYLKAREQGRIDCPRENVLLFYTTRDGEIHFNTTRITHADGTDASDLTRAEIDSRKQVTQLVEFLRSEISGFENAYLQMTATQIGVRETRRIVGEYVMTVDDVLEGRKFPDCIARGSYPVDIHNPEGGGTVIRSLRPGESYDIPYRSIVPLEIDNLLIAGRPISTTHEAHSSIRIMPIVMAIGEAAGAAAALCVRDGLTPRELNVDSLRNALRAQGANLG
jgi:hypothetical protein